MCTNHYCVDIHTKKGIYKGKKYIRIPQLLHLFVDVILSGCRVVATALQPLLYLYMLRYYASQIRNQPNRQKSILAITTLGDR